MVVVVGTLVYKIDLLLTRSRFESVPQSVLRSHVSGGYQHRRMSDWPKVRVQYYNRKLQL